MDSKCFCHFDEYEVKDAKARQGVEENKESIKHVANTINAINGDGLLGLDVVDGHLTLYTRNIDNTTFKVDNDGVLTVDLHGV